jgi:type II restriction enzyme
VLAAIAVEGQIPIIQSGILQPKGLTRNAFARLEGLSALSYKERGWAATILNLLNRLPGNFAIADVYRFDSELEKLYPNNRNVRPKIRQQLQVLRDAGLIKFLGGGRYERTVERR